MYPPRENRDPQPHKKKTTKRKDPPRPPPPTQKKKKKKKKKEKEKKTREKKGKKKKKKRELSLRILPRRTRLLTSLHREKAWRRGLQQQYLWDLSSISSSFMDCRAFITKLRIEHSLQSIFCTFPMWSKSRSSTVPVLSPSVRLILA